MESGNYSLLRTIQAALASEAVGNRDPSQSPLPTVDVIADGSPLLPRDFGCVAWRASGLLSGDMEEHGNLQLSGHLPQVLLCSVRCSAPCAWSAYARRDAGLVD